MIAESTDRHSSLILIADDDKFTRLMLRQVMEKEGYKVEEVENGQQCLTTYEMLRPDMVLLDAMMPAMDGFACCKHLRSLTEENNIPILMITGLNDQASVDWAFEAGATDYITKPIHPPVLRQRVRRLLETRAARTALQESERQYRSVVENVKEVIFQTNATGEWIFLNPAWTKLTEFAVEESLGKSFKDYVYADDQQLHQELWQALLKGDKSSCRHEIRYLTQSGQCRWIEIHANAMYLPNGAIAGISGILQDITQRLYAAALEKEKVRLETEVSERRRSEETIAKALERETELAQLREHIISTISHEFRTPLTTIQSSSELLQLYNQKLSEEKKDKYFQRITESVKHMTKLLDDTLFIGQAETGQLQFNPTTVNVEQLCREIVQTWQSGLDSQHQLTFSYQGDDTQGTLDATLLQYILTNLLSNAVKYSPKGGTIQFDLICQQGHALFRLQDEGIGIPPNEIPRVYESFYKASNTGVIGGTGLGLAIVKKCVDLHHGQIAINSNVNIGTTVTVTLPLN